MLLLSLIIYLILWLPYHFLIEPFFDLFQVVGWLSIPIFFVISLLISWIIVFLIHSYKPELKLFTRNLIRVRGVKWIALLTGASGIIVLLFSLDIVGLSVATVGVLVPLSATLLANALGIEIVPKLLQEDVVPFRVVSIPEPTKPQIPEDIAKEYRWNQNGKDYSLRLVIRRAVYEHFRAEPRVPSSEWSKEYVAKGICGEVRELAHQLIKIGNPFGTFAEVNFILHFVQSVITYKSDVGEYPKYPLETLAEDSGDCEDFSILGAAILKVMGYDVALLFLPGHAALGVAGATGIPGAYAESEGKRYYYVEMTSTGWKIGEIPSEYKDSAITVVPVPGIQVHAAA